MRGLFFLGLLMLLSSCSHRADLSLYPSDLVAKNCPIYQKEQKINIAKITFETQSLSLDKKAKTLLEEVAEMSKRCRAFVDIKGYQQSSEPKDYGLLRAGVVAKEIEKQGVFQPYIKFSQSNNNNQAEVLISFDFSKTIGDQ